MQSLSSPHTTCILSKENHRHHTADDVRIPRETPRVVVKINLQKLKRTFATDEELTGYADVFL